MSICYNPLGNSQSEGVESGYISRGVNIILQSDYVAWLNNYSLENSGMCSLIYISI